MAGAGAIAAAVENVCILWTLYVPLSLKVFQHKLYACLLAEHTVQLS